MCKEIQQENLKQSRIILTAWEKAKAHNLASIKTEKTDFGTRVAVLGHIQRGGCPTVFDRSLAA